MHGVYVLQNADGRIYIGQTSDLARRIAQHNDPDNRLSRTTKRFRGPWLLAYSESAVDRTAALRRERELKTSRGRAWLRDLLGGQKKKAG